MKVLNFTGCRLRVGGDDTLEDGSKASPHGVFVIASPGAPFQRSQLPHATSCRHFHLGPPQPQQLAPDFPLAHPVQSQPGLSAHMAPAHQHSGALHQSLTPLPALQFQDVTGPSFLPQALHQQYLLQQQLLEAQHRRLVSHPRCVRHMGEGGRGRGMCATRAEVGGAGAGCGLPRHFRGGSLYPGAHGDHWWFLPGGSDGKELACNAGDPGSIPGSGRSSGEGNGNPLQYSCLENSVDRGT